MLLKLDSQGGPKLANSYCLVDKMLDHQRLEENTSITNSDPQESGFWQRISYPLYVKNYSAKNLHDLHETQPRNSDENIRETQNGNEKRKGYWQSEMCGDWQVKWKTLR